MNRRFCFGKVGSTWRCFNCAGVARLGRGLANLRSSHLGNDRLMVMGLVGLVVELAGPCRLPPGRSSIAALPILLSGQVQPACARPPYLPAFWKLVARVGLAPTPPGLIPIPNRDYFDTGFCPMGDLPKVAAQAGIAPAQSG